MPLRHPVIAADPGTADLGAALRAFFAATSGTEGADVAVSTGVPTTEAAHVIVSGPLTDEVDAWDASVAPQTLAGALWLPPDQQDGVSAATAWLLLRLQTPATPLSDLTDGRQRALRWSVATATTVTFPSQQSPVADPDEVRDWVDAQPAVAALGAAVERIGGETGEAVLTSVERFRAALHAVGGAADLPGFEAAVAEHLRQVQRSGFSRWRGAKARAASATALHEAARGAAASSVQALLDRRTAEVVAEAGAARAAQDRQAVATAIGQALSSLTLPVEPDFAEVPRSWGEAAPPPRRYLFVAEDDLDGLPEVPAHTSVRACGEVPAGTAICALVQSGFSLPAIRHD